MSKIIKYGETGYVDWNGQDNEAINIRPMFIDKTPQALGCRIIHSVKSKHRLHFFGPLKKVLMPYVKGFQGGKLADKFQKEVYLKEFKAEQAYDKHGYADMIYYELVNQGGVKQNDITGTLVEAAERKIFFDAIYHDVIRQFWLGDTSKVHVAAGTYNDGSSYAIGDPDKNYNQIDGILKRLMTDAATNPNSEQVKRFVMPTLTTDTVEGLCETMLWDSNDVLRLLQNKDELVWLASKNVIKNYRDTVLTDGTEAARVMKMNGTTTYLYDGIPFMEMPIHNELSVDFDSSIWPSDFLILTTVRNLALILNSRGDFAETRYWFNPDENENRQRAQFEFGADYIMPELVSIAYPNVS